MKLRKCVSLFLFYIFERGTQINHTLKFSQNILPKEKKNHWSFKKVVLGVENKIRQEVGDAANRDMHFCSFTIDKAYLFTLTAYCNNFIM